MAPQLRAATPADIRALADTFISGVNLSIPGRQLGDEFYDLEADIAPGELGSSPGKLWTRFSEQFTREHIWLAEVEEKIAGYIAWRDPTQSDPLEGGKAGEITYLFVHPSFHGRGIGTVLLNHAKEHVLTVVSEDFDGQLLMEVRCFEKNLNGLKFYERGGFTRKHGAEEWHERVQEYLALLQWFK